MEIHRDVGVAEYCWMDVQSGTHGIDGQNRPHALISWSRLNHWLAQPSSMEEQRKTGSYYPGGDQKSTHWFNDRFRLAGVMPYEQPQNSDSDTHYQVFNSHGRAQIWDVFQAYAPRIVRSTFLQSRS